MSNFIYSSQKAVPYVYKLTHKITNEFYIGYREANKEPSSKDIGFKYFSSSKKIKNDFDNYHIEIIAEFFGENAGLYAFEFEQNLIQDNIKNPLNLNGYVNLKFYGGGPKSQCHRDKIGKAHRGKKKSQEHISNLKKYHQLNPMSQEKRKQIGEKNKNRIDAMTPTELANWGCKISKRNKGRIKTEKEKLSISNALKGKKKSEAHRHKIGDRHRGKKLSETQKQQISEKFSGEKHPRAKKWTLKSPDGKIFKTKEIRAFCQSNNLAYSILRYKGQNKNTMPITSGLSKGWSVLEYE